MKTRRAEIWLVLGLLVIVLVPRLVRLSADPPLDFQTGYQPDEGAWAHNARQHVLFGHWVMEEHNPGLFAAPLYTVVLAGFYRLAGVGLLQTRLLSAMAGSLTCLLLYVLLRTDRTPRESMPPVLILGASYFMLTNNRVGFTESLQLVFIIAACLAVLRAARNPWWGALGGVFFIASLLAKPSAVVLAPIFLGFWILHRVFARRDDGLPRFSFRAVAWFALGAGVTSLIVFLSLVRPHWASILQQLTISSRNVYGAAAGEDRPRLVLFGWEALGMTLNLFWTQCAVLLVAAGALLIGRLGKALPSRPDLVELLCGSWIVVGLLFLASQGYQPDRRFLFLLPPIAVLAWQGASEGALRLPAREEWRGPGAVRYSMLLGAFLGAAVAFYAYPVLNHRILPALALSQILPLQTWAGGWVVTVGLVLGAVVGPFARRLLPHSSHRLPTALFVMLFLLTDPIRFGFYIARPSYGGRDAARALSQVTKDWSPTDRVVVGNSAYTLALETKLFAFNIRRREETGDYENLDGWNRFHPAIAVVTAWRGKPVQDPIQLPIVRGIRVHGMVLCREVPLSYDSQRPARVARYYVRSDLLKSCPADQPSPS